MPRRLVSDEPRAAGEAGVDAEQVRGVLTAVAPIVGTARVVSATGSIAGALALEVELAELDDQRAVAATHSGRRSTH